MGALLFVRSVDDVARAVEAVNAVLGRQKAPEATAEVLGIVVRKAVDWDLPAPAPAGAGQASDDVALRESVALSGIWSLCSFDLGAAGERDHAHDRRRRLLDALVRGNEADHADAMVFLPVLTRAEADREVTALLHDLMERYPAVAIGQECFVHAPVRGGFVRLAENDEPSGARRSS